MEYVHEPVLLREAMENLSITPDGVYVDGTVGSGGHSLALARKLGPKGRLVCLDRDPGAVRLATKRLGFPGNRASVVRASYGNLDEILWKQGIQGVHGILLDLGMSTHQLERSGRGFSFNRAEPLDMRMDPDLEVTAADLVNTLSRGRLVAIFKKYGEEKRAGSIAAKILRVRERAPIRTSLQLAELIRSVYPAQGRAGRKHPATKTFQALRIAVNAELEILRVFLEKVPSLVRERGRVVIISYHSLEDRMVKLRMEKWERPCTCPPDFPRCVCGKASLFRRVGERPIKPGRTEIHQNPKARSARMRVAERVMQ